MHKCPVCVIDISDIEEHQQSLKHKINNVDLKSIDKCPVCGLEIVSLEEHLQVCKFLESF